MSVSMHANLKRSGTDGKDSRIHSRIQNSEFRIQNSEVRSQESGVRSQESGVRSQELKEFRSECEQGLPESRFSRKMGALVFCNSCNFFSGATVAALVLILLAGLLQIRLGFGGFRGRGGDANGVWCVEIDFQNPFRFE
jgi:hypothetical protein